MHSMLQSTWPVSISSKRRRQSREFYKFMVKPPRKITLLSRHAILDLPNLGVDFNRPT